MGWVADLISRIQRWIEAVGFQDAEKNYIAANLQWAALFTGASCVLASLVYLFVIQRPYTVAVLLISSALYLAVIWLVRQRHLTGASTLYLSAMLGIVTYELHMANGIRSIGVILYPVVVIFASLILSRRLFSLYVGLVLASVGSVIYGQMQGWVQVATLEPPSFAVFLLYTLILSGTGLIVRMLAESWRHALGRAQRNERELAAQNAMLDRVGQAVVGCQADSTVIYWNQAATDLYGWNAPEALGRKYYDVVPTPMSPEMTESIRASLRQGAVWSGEMLAQRRDGVSIPILSTLAPLLDGRGAVTGWVGIAANLTERKRAEAELLESEARFRGLFHHSMDAVILIDQDGRVAELNPAAQALFQLDRDETLGQPVWDIQASRLTDADRQVISADAIRDGLVNILRTGQLPGTPHALVTDIQLPDGQIRSVQQTWFAIPHGAQFRIASISRDVTEQKQADALRVQAEAALRTGAMRQRLLDFSRDLLSTVDVGEILEIIRRTAADLIPHDVFSPYWVDEAAGVLRPVETRGRRWFSDPQFHTWTIPLGQGIMGDAARKQRAECVNDSHLDPRSIYPPGFREQVAHEHSIILPIRSGEKMLGILALLRRTGPAFTPDEFELAQLLMSLAELALSNARLFGELEQRVVERTAQLAASEERYRNFIENSAEGIWLMAFDAPIPLDLSPQAQVRRIQQHGYVAECNDALARMYGYSSRREMLGKRLLELYGGQANEQNTRATLTLVQAGYRSSDRETREVNAQGETIYFSNNAAGVIKENALVGLWGTQRDITRLKQAGAEREKLVAELQAKNAELERFTYTVSHDLKAPLVTIRGFVGFLEKDMLAGKSDRVKSDIARILGAADKMQRLLNELLELSRVGRMMNPPQAVAFEAIVREALDLVRGRLQARGVRVEIAPGLPVVHGDRMRLIQAMQNLLDNAAKFMGDQSNPTIEIGQRRGEADPREAAPGQPVLFVRDNGIGIAPQDHERVFGLFDKLNAQGEGTGVGLALVKRIVEVHGGKIWVESHGINCGATFCFTLPAVPASGDKP